MGAPSVPPERRGLDPRRPDDGARGQAIRPERHARGVDPRDRGARPHLNPERLELPRGAARKVLGKRGQDAAPRLHEDDTRGARIDAPEVAGEAVAGGLGESSRHLDAGGAAPHDHEGQAGPARLWIVGGLGLLEGQERAVADGEGVVEGLEARSVFGPGVVPEVGMGGSGGEDQEVVDELALGEA